MRVAHLPGLTAVLNRLSKAARPSTIIRSRDLLLAIHQQRPSLEMVSLEYLPVWSLLVHVRQVVLHALRGKHADVLEVEGLKDVFLEVVVQ